MRGAHTGATILVLALAAVGCSNQITCDCLTPDPTDVELQVVAEGLSAPVFLTAAPGDTGRLFVVERPGRVRIVRDGTLLASPFLDIVNVTGSGAERGLLSIAFHPDYATNGHFYVNHTDRSGDTRIVRYTVSANPDVADPTSALPILSQSQPFANHNGGQIAFGPDGMLYIGFGDGGDGGDPLGHGQNPATFLGSLLRIDVDGGVPYAVPADNPLLGDPVARPETWAYGLRNPWRFSFDRANGDLYIADVGQGAREEISYQPASTGGGQNYGWNTMEGTACYSPASGCDRTGLVLPISDYGHDSGCSVTGGYVYRGAAAPALAGRYFFGDYCDGWVWSFRVENGSPVDLIDHAPAFGTIPQISSFGEDAAGELYVLSLSGMVYRVTTP